MSHPAQPSPDDGAETGIGSAGPTVTSPKGRTHTAGAFDIRNFIGSLLAIYGVVLTLTGLLGDQALDRTGGINANLWAGLALLVVGLGFMGWARAQPVVVDDAQVEADASTRHPH